MRRLRPRRLQPLLLPAAVIAILLALFLNAVLTLAAVHRGDPAGSVPPEPKGASTLETWKDRLSVAESAFTILAVVVGGIWTWMLFVSKREKYPKAKLKHKSVVKVLDTSNHRLLHCTLRVENCGGVLLSLESGLTRVQQILPPPAEVVKAVMAGKDPVPANQPEYPWPELGERTYNWAQRTLELEPGESEEIHCDFVLDPTVASVEIYSYLKNVTKSGREIGWNLTTVHDI